LTFFDLFGGFFDPLFWTPRIPKTGPPENPRTPRKPEIGQKGPKNTPAKTPYDEKVTFLSMTPFLDEKRHPLKPLTMQKVDLFTPRTKKVQKTPPAKTPYDEKVVVFLARTVLGVKKTPAKRTYDVNHH